MPEHAKPDHQAGVIPIGVEPWECGDLVITVCGKPVGPAIGSDREARLIAEWLRSAIWGIRSESQDAADAYLNRADRETSWGVFAKARRIGTVQGADAIAALGRARRQFPGTPDVVVSPEPEG
jgi:hypothetical protein